MNAPEATATAAMISCHSMAVKAAEIWSTVIEKRLSRLTVRVCAVYLDHWQPINFPPEGFKVYRCIFQSTPFLPHSCPFSCARSSQFFLFEPYPNRRQIHMRHLTRLQFFSSQSQTRSNPNAASALSCLVWLHNFSSDVIPYMTWKLRDCIG